MSLSDYPKIYVAVDMYQSHFRRILMGCRDYLNTHHTPWILADRWHPMSNEKLSAGIDAAILQGDQGDALKTLQDLNIPFIQVSGRTPPEPGQWTVLPDNQAIGETAAAYFISQGFQSFACLTPKGHWYGSERAKGFQGRLGDRHLDLWTQGYDTPEKLRQYETWLKSLPQGTALFCVSDVFARTAIRHLMGMGRKVPEEISVVGVDDDEVESVLSPVPISSVDTRGRQIGAVAAGLLDRLLQGEKPKERLTLVPTGEVIVRTSSDILQIEDPVVAKALALIRDQACAGLGVADVLQNVAVSRRTLERRFKETLDRGIENEIRRVRLERGRHLLASTQYTVSEIAHLVGFKDIFYFSACFKTHHGESPAAWRKRHADRA